MTTVLLLGTSILVLVLFVAASAFCLQLGSRWMMISNVTFGRALWATVAVGFVEVIMAAPLGWIHFPDWRWAILALVVEIVLSLGLTWLVIAWILKTSMFRAFVVWLPTLIPAACLCGVAMFVARLYLFEVFTDPSNTMAPTVLGRHWEAPCPRCGSPAYCSPEDERWKPANKPVLMICSKELRSCEVANPPHGEHAGDRFIVNKFISPRRWDVIVFRSPEEPKVFVCKRLVGLPGETVTIGDAAVWIDGQRQHPPASCQGVEYFDGFRGHDAPFWGSAAQPAKLGPDEYYVLGDFSARAKDSRCWEQGAPGHPPYAVPAANIVGVVTHIFWPPERCRALR